MRFKNGSNKVVIELRVVQFWSEIILVISNRTRAARSLDFEITRMISDPTRTTTWNLPGPSGSRDCINIVNLSHPSPRFCGGLNNFKPTDLQRENKMMIIHNADCSATCKQCYSIVFINDFTRRKKRKKRTHRQDSFLRPVISAYI